MKTPPMGSNCSKKKENEKKHFNQTSTKITDFVRKIQIFQPLNANEMNEIMQMKSQEKDACMTAYHHAMTYLLQIKNNTPK